MSVNAKNYHEQGGDRWVVEGELDIVGDGAVKVNGQPVNLSITPAAYQADSVADNVADLAADFNALLAKLRAAGLMEAE